VVEEVGEKAMEKMEKLKKEEEKMEEGSF